MLHLHSGPCQLSVSQLSEEETLAFQFQSADVWKSADIHCLNRDSRGWRGRLAAPHCGNVWHRQSMHISMCTHTHTRKHRECYFRGKRRERGDGVADGSCGEKFKNSAMSLERGLKEYFPTIQWDVQTNAWPTRPSPAHTLFHQCPVNEPITECEQN